MSILVNGVLLVLVIGIELKSCNQHLNFLLVFYGIFMNHFPV